MAHTSKAIVLLACFFCFAVELSATQQSSQAQVKVEFRFAEINPADGLKEAIVKGKGDKVYLRKEIVVTDADILEARVAQDQNSSFFEINIRFTDEGARKMEEATKDSIGKYLAVIVDGQVLVAARVNQTIKDQSVITGTITKAEAEMIANAINKK